MPDLTHIAAALAPLTSRVRTDVTATRSEAGHMAWRADQPLTDERLARHLNGGPARGVCPIKAGESTTRVAVLDFDSHDGKVTWPEMSAVVQRVADALEMAHGLEPILFRSGGGRGVHLYLLWDEPQDAYSVRQLLKGVLVSCGLKDGAGGVDASRVEIFPKQNEVKPDGFGNQFILPGSRASAPLSWGKYDWEEEDLAS